MNDADVRALWNDLAYLRRRIERLERAQELIEERLRARLKEEAEARENELTNAYDEGYSMALAGDDD